MQCTSTKLRQVSKRGIGDAPLRFNVSSVDPHVFQLLMDFYEDELSVLQGDRKHLRYEDVAFFGSRKFGAYCGYLPQYLFQLHRVARKKLENFYA